MFQRCILQYSRWEDLPEATQAFFVQIMDNQAFLGRDFFELYFYWFNIAHQCGHILRKYYGTLSESRWVDEEATNQFAVAYWRTFGELARLEQLAQLARGARRLLPNPILPDQDPPTFFDTHYDQFASNLPAQTYLQLTWVLDAVDRPVDLPQVLTAQITQDALAVAPPPPLAYPEVQAGLPLRIIPDVRTLLARYRVRLPEVAVVCAYSPEIQYVSFE